MSWLGWLVAIVALLWLAEHAFAWAWHRWTGDRLSVGGWLRGLWK